jgi:hypothetical protein
MSYICEFCGARPENCGCSVDLTEPRLETELAVADNMMAVENSNIQKPYGLLDAPSASAFFTLLVELEKQETDVELGPEPKWMSQTNNQDEPLGTIPTTPRKSSDVFPPIPKLERQTNMPEGINYPDDDDLQGIAINLFPEYIHYPKSCEYMALSSKLGNASSYEDFCSILLEMKDLYDVEASVSKEVDKYCETCCSFSCECDMMVPCECGTLYDIREPYKMCNKCEMAMRRQDSIDELIHPDDIPDRDRDRDSYSYDSDSN